MEAVLPVGLRASVNAVQEKPSPLVRFLPLAVANIVVALWAWAFSLRFYPELWFPSPAAVVQGFRFRSLSPLAWIPFAVLWFGVGEKPAIFLIFMASCSPMALATAGWVLRSGTPGTGCERTCWYAR